MKIYDISQPIPGCAVYPGDPAPAVELQTVGPEEAPMAAHKALLGAGTVLLEGLRLSAVPPGRYFLSAAPLPLVGTDGAPCRAVLMELEVRKKSAGVKCTPKVRHFRGANFYGEKREQVQKVLGRIQDICYSGYAGTPSGLQGNNAKVFSREGIQGLWLHSKVGTHISGRRSRGTNERLTIKSQESR